MKGGTAWRGAALGLLLVREASAQLGFWDGLRDPSGRAGADATATAERMLWNAEQSYGVAAMERDFIAAAASIARLPSRKADADARLLFFRGRALSSPWSRDLPAARSLLSRALAREPAAEFAGDAWFRLGIVLACGGAYADAVSAYTMALTLIWESERRAEVQIELAETLLAQREIVEAAGAFEHAARSALHVRVGAMAYFGLASALERSGQPTGALAAARIARSAVMPKRYYGVNDVLALPALGCSLLDPERQFRRALGATAVAFESADQDERTARLDTAVGAWDAYLSLAPWDDRVGRSRGEARRTQCVDALGGVAPGRPEPDPLDPIP